MGSSGEDPNRGINGSAGGLVWVRQRDGSWWPGKILSPDELPEGSVSAPRSGTPVKLLGKEDSSVDWYNLEKSKRVKPFHCGDYDQFIEKIKASASNNPSKRAPKYAERDGAILHALKLESALVSKDHVDESPSASYPSEESEDFDDNSDHSGDDSDSAREDYPFEEPDCSEDGSKRMRGLEDLGMKIELPLKRKISQIGHNQEIMKRKNKRRALTKVLESTMVPVHVGEQGSSTNGLCMVIASNSEVSSLESNDSNKNNSNSNDNESFGRLFDVPLAAEEKRSAGAGTRSSQSRDIETSPLANEENDESGPTCLSVPNAHISQRIEKGTSEWQSKGKRNSRPRKLDIPNEAETYVGPTQHLRRAFLSRPIGETRSLPYRQSRFMVNPKYESSDFFSHRHHIACSSLYDVPLEVKSSYRAHHVPYISLISKLTGHPIVGHPITVEALDDGSCNDLISISKCYYNTVHERNSRGKPPNKQHHTRRLLSISLKSRKNGILSKKTRKLSLLTGSRGLGRDEKKKLLVEKIKGPSIACVPLNVVFSRINADLSSWVRPVARPIVA